MNDLLGEAIASNNIDKTKIYIWRDREIPWIMVIIGTAI